MNKGIEVKYEEKNIVTIQLVEGISELFEKHKDFSEQCFEEIDKLLYFLKNRNEDR